MTAVCASLACGPAQRRCLAATWRMLGLGLFATLLVVAAAAAADDAWPTKAVRLIVPFPPGGPADAIARIVGERLTARTQQPVIIDNRPGAGGNIGMALVAKAAADGYTLALAPAGNLTVNPFLYRDVPYDVGRDFAPVTVLAAVPNILVVHPSLPVPSVAELIDYARAHPGSVNFASAGNGSGAHLAGEWLQAQSGTKMTHVPFNGVAPAVTAVLGGQVQWMFGASSAVLPHVKAGKLIALAVASPRRLAAAPELPTMIESGFKDFEVTSWHSIVVPAQVSGAVITRMHGQLVAILAEPEVRARLAGLGAEPVGNTPGEFAAMIKSESARWGQIVRDAHITAE